MIIILVLLVVILFNLVCRTQKRLTFYGGKTMVSDYTFKRYPKFCCDTDPKPISKEEYNKLISTTTNEDTKFLYKVMTNPSIRVLSFFDDDSYSGKYLYKKKINNISEKQGKNIYYQISIMNDYPTDKYPKKSNYSITVYFIDDKTVPNASLITKNFYNTIIASKLFLNKNSIDILKYQDLDNFNSFKMKDSRISFNTFLNFINTEISLYDQEKILGIHGILAYYLGLRKMKDIDLFVNNDRVLTNKILAFDKYDTSNISRFEKINIFESLFNYRIELLIKNKKIENIFTDSKNYLYFFGLKCISLDHNMKLRYIRQRPKAISEIIAFNSKNPEKQYPVPKIPKYKYKLPSSLSSVLAYDMENEYEVLRKVLNIDIEPNPVDQKEFNKTISYYLKSLYGIKPISSE